MNYLQEIDIPSAKERFMGNEGLYKRFLFQLPEKGMMEQIQEHLDAGNAEEAFRAAHTMKGVVGNLSLNRLMQEVSSVTEVLRNGELPDAEKVELLRKTYDEVVEAIAEVKELSIPLF